MLLDQVEIVTPSENQLVMEQYTIGLNLIYIYQRSGLYLITTPNGVDSEAAAVIIRGANRTTICGSRYSRARYDPRLDRGPE